MPNYTRTHINGGTYFFTLVTHQRIPILDKPMVRKAIQESITATRKKYPVTLNAWVLMPDHLHFIWTLPTDDSNYARRISLIKMGVSRRLASCFYYSSKRGDEGRLRRERSIWQRRFWEHAIRDERDLKNHIDYLHFNPVKHGLVEKVRDWPHSSFHEYCQRGYYKEDWGVGDQLVTVAGE